MRKLAVALAFAASFAAASALAADKFIVVSSTSSTEDSGLFGYILPKFTAKTGIEVRVVALGTGKAVEVAKRGDADVLLVHHRPSEDAFVAQGFGVKRYDVMYNDFIVVGPKSDPVGIRGMKEAAAAFKKIAAAKAPFCSRGDKSGTHMAELAIWKTAGIDVAPVSGTWYRDTGSGMGPTLNTASGMNAYAVADRGTWISFKNKGELQILLEGDPILFNPYGVILVNKAKHPHVKAEMGQAFIDWLVSAEGQKAIGDFKIEGQPLFMPNSKS
jgi:tungstate transport system substrate-binding protein